MDLSNAAALVTGGASGLGRATADALAEAGAIVTVADLPGVLERVDLGAHRAAAVDVTSVDEVFAAAAAAAAEAPLRVAVACAGIGRPGRLLPRKGAAALDVIRAEVEVNLIGTINLTAAAAAVMRDQEPDGEDRGVVVTTASAAAFDGQVGQVGYGASKGGVVAMTLPAARELAAYGIRVMSIAPGIFDTPMLGSLPDDVRASLGAQVPHPSRLGHPDEFAATVLQVVRNPMLNGTVIRLDGALRMAPS